MSHSLPNSRHVQQQSPSLTTPTYHRLRQPQPQQASGSKASMSRTLPHNASITSNPYLPSQHTEEEPDFWLGNPKYNTSIAASPGLIHATADVYSVDEDTSHRESSFDDYLTTEASSENHLSEHTTPQELIWEQQFASQTASHPQILDSYASPDFDNAQGATATSEFRSIFLDSEESLPKFNPGPEFQSSKRLLAGSSLPLSAHGESVDHRPPQAMESAPQHKRSVSQNLKVDTAPNHTPFPGHTIGAWRHASIMRAPSPVVMVSDYGTSHVKPEAMETIVPASSKRSRGSVSSDDEEEDESEEPGSRKYSGAKAYLMPPAAGGSEPVRSASPQRSGVEPQSRDDEVVDSFKDMDDKRQRNERNVHVQEWLATSDAGSDSGDQGSTRNSHRSPQGSRRRAHSAETHLDALGRVYSDAHIPGPGALVEVESDDEYFDDSDEVQVHTDMVIQEYLGSGSPQLSPRALESRQDSEQTAFPPLELDEQRDEQDQQDQQEPLPTQFIHRGPWQDSDAGPIVNTKNQPNSSNAAAYQFNQEAAKWETSSRAATWGTRRRLSESEVLSIVDGSQVRHLSLSKRGRERGSSFLKQARGIFPRRSSSNIKEDPSAATKDSAPSGHSHRTSVGSIKPAQRVPSWGKHPKSPSMSTGSAFLAMTGQLAAVGRGNSVAQEVDSVKSSGPVQALKKQRSKSDVAKNVNNPGGLADLMARHGGPPVPTLASPMHERESILAAQIIDNEDVPVDEDEDDTDELGIKMDLEIRAEDIPPTLEGFRDHARKLNPRLPPYLLDRVAHEQIRRYKKLVETKVKHTRSVLVTQKCASGKFCFELGGEAKRLAPRVSSRDPDTTLTQFQVSNLADDEIDDSGFTDGIITPALFPNGIPLPPVQRLPSEFECNLCFKVKKFQKPSDWTKHVHEDVQPFSCTFPNCLESKSFKRKADWVRHENERHRHLEWWRCSVQECNHICYRKDNFVQHLVREHKMTEPKVKRGSGSSKNKPVNNGFAEDSEVWKLVEDCHFDTEKKTRDEPCPFCGNICSTFKKLSVHMGKHMEQIAMPVLALVEMREVAPDTIISPVEQPQVVASSFAPAPGAVHNVDQSNLSPYPTSATSAYQTSSAGQSPASMHGRPQNGGFIYDHTYYSPHTTTPAPQGPLMVGNFGGFGSYMHQSPTYMPSAQAGLQHDRNLSPQTAMVTPRSQPAIQGYEGSMYESAGPMYSQGPMQHMYASPHSHSPLMPEYGTRPYTSSMQQGHGQSGHSSPMNVAVQGGLGLQTPVDQHQQGQYTYFA